MENPNVSVSSSNDYLDISNGDIAVPSEFVSKIDLGVGNGVMLRTRLNKGLKYYATSSEGFKESDDKIIIKYPSMVTTINLKTINIAASGTKAVLEGYEGYHIYNADGKYLGIAPKEMEFFSKYYVSDEKINMSTTSTSSSSTSSSSKVSSSSISSSSTGTTGAPNTGGLAITTEKAKSETVKAVSVAKASGSKTASVRFKDATSISPAALKAMPGSASGLAINLISDTMSKTSVVGRITINPALASKITRDTQLGVYIDSANTNATKTKFEKHFKNKIVVVSLAHQGSYGMTVRIAAKPNFGTLNKKSLYLYNYDKTENKYTIIQNSAATIDANGYIHFNTTLGGDILITDSPMARK